MPDSIYRNGHLRLFHLRTVEIVFLHEGRADEFHPVGTHTYTCMVPCKLCSAFEPYKNVYCFRS